MIFCSPTSAPGDVVDERPADAAAVAGVDEAVLRTGVERVFAVDELRVEHHVALLSGAFQVGEAFPVFEVLRAGDACGGDRCREVVRGREVLALGAEDAVNPPVLVGRQAHVVDIRVGIAGLGHPDRIFPEPEIVDAVGTLGDGEERFAVVAFDAHRQHVFAVVEHGPGVERAVDAETLHAVGVAFGREVVAPLQRRVVTRQHRKSVPFVNPVSGQQRFVFTLQKPVVLLAQGV